MKLCLYSNGIRLDDLVVQRRIMGVFTANHGIQVVIAADDQMKHSK